MKPTSRASTSRCASSPMPASPWAVSSAGPSSLPVASPSSNSPARPASRSSGPTCSFPSRSLQAPSLPSCLVYMLIYQLDELAIFFTAVFTLKASRLEEKHGRILKLIGGTLMLTLAVVMLFKPELMNKLSSSLIIFAIAFGATLLILLLHQVILAPFRYSHRHRPRRAPGSQKAFSRSPKG